MTSETDINAKNAQHGLKVVPVKDETLDAEADYFEPFYEDEAEEALVRLTEAMKLHEIKKS
jgi:hypothetical protein